MYTSLRCGSQQGGPPMAPFHCGSSPSLCPLLLMLLGLGAFGGLLWVAPIGFHCDFASSHSDANSPNQHLKERPLTPQPGSFRCCTASMAKFLAATLALCGSPQVEGKWPLRGGKELADVPASFDCVPRRNVGKRCVA